MFKINKSIKVDIQEELLNLEPLLKNISGTKEIINFEKLYLIYIFSISILFLFLLLNIPLIFIFILIMINIITTINIYKLNKLYRNKQLIYKEKVKKKLEKLFPLIPIYSIIKNDEIIYYTKLIIYKNKEILTEIIKPTNYYFNHLNKDEIYMLIGLIYSSNKFIHTYPEIKNLLSDNNVCIWSINGMNFKLNILDDNHNTIFTKELDLSKEEKLNPQWTWKKN